MRIFLSRQFMAFIVTGGIAAAVNFVSRIAYSQLMSFSSAVIVAYLTGMVTAYLLARIFVFRETRNTTFQSASFFTLVNLFAVLQTWAVSMLLAYYLLPWMGVNHFVEEIAHFVGIAVPVFTSFIGHKHLSFRT